MSAKHTPGPWLSSFSGGTAAYICESDGTTVVRLDTLENSSSHHHLSANASLIAAAPDLLKALQEICEWTERYTAPGHPIATVAKRAIAKATGGEV